MAERADFCEDILPQLEGKNFIHDEFFAKLDEFDVGNDEDNLFELVMYTHGYDELVLQYILKQKNINWSALLEAAFARTVSIGNIKKDPNLPVVYYILQNRFERIEIGTWTSIISCFLEHVTGKVHDHFKPEN
jgi:hypothetical protein